MNKMILKTMFISWSETKIMSLLYLLTYKLGYVYIKWVQVTN